VPTLSLLSHRHDPYWDVDGASARRARVKRRVSRFGVWIVMLALLAAALTRLPSIDPGYLLQGGGRPILGAALLGLVGAAALLALARVRYLKRRR
jgi:hypothetical protein